MCKRKTKKKKEKKRREKKMNESGICVVTDSKDKGSNYICQS